MADTKPPVSERFSPCGHLGSDGTIPDDDDDDLGAPILHLSKSLTDVATDTRDREEVTRCRPDLRKSASSAVCQQGDPETAWTPERAYRGFAGTPPPWGAPMSPAVVNRLRPCRGRGLAPGGHLPQTASSSKDLRGERQDQALQRSHSVSLHAAREAHSRGPGSCNESGFACPGAGCCFRRVPGCYSLGCRQAANPDTAPACAGGGYWSPAPPPRGGLWVCTPSPSASPRDSRGHFCRAARIGSGGDDWGPELRACCHHGPTAVDGGSGDEPWRPRGATLSFPRLTSSASDTRLDGAHQAAGRCCGAASPRASPKRGPTEGRTSAEAATMTSRPELRDAGVQAGPLGSPSSLHVFPKVSLAGGEGAAGEGSEAGQTSPVKEVMWDAEGMTWEVYGAAVDPQELGVAIQRHLELQIKEVAASRASKLSQRDAGTSQRGGSRKKRKSMVGLLRKPICCIRPRTTGD